MSENKFPERSYGEAGLRCFVGGVILHSNSRNNVLYLTTKFKARLVVAAYSFGAAEYKTFIVTLSALQLVFIVKWIPGLIVLPTLHGLRAIGLLHCFRQLSWRNLFLSGILGKLERICHHLANWREANDQKHMMASMNLIWSFALWIYFKIQSMLRQ